MTFTQVATNLLDLWMEPRYNSERASQLLFNEPLKVVEEQEFFLKVVQTDGYTGWADKRFLFKTSNSEFKNFDRSSNFIVTSDRAQLYGQNQNTIPPHYLYYGTKIKAAKSKSGFIRFRLPSGEIAFIKPQNLKPINKNDKPTGQKVLKEAQKWLGVPYLWGGTTPAGFDCSGFVRRVFAQFNVYLPRDTKDQINSGQEVGRNSIRTGDLVFFKRHVGIAVTKGILLHCSLGANGVRLQSIEKGGDDYRSDLDKNYLTTRRIF